MSGGRNSLLPASWSICVEKTTELINKLEGRRKTFTLEVPIPMNVRELLADQTQASISFDFECPITEMIRVAMFSKTCQNWSNVALSYGDTDGHLDDFCNGDRYHRIAKSMSRDSVILGAVLATDGICMDKCMFDSQEVPHRMSSLGFSTGFLMYPPAPSHNRWARCRALLFVAMLGSGTNA